MQSGLLLLNYSVRHLFARRTQVALTVIGIALVVFVFLASLMLAEGIRYTLASTGEPRNVIALSIGAQNEIQSGISREDTSILLSQPQVESIDSTTKSLASSDVVVIVTLRKRADNETSNVTLRGVSESVYQVRPQVILTEGRLPNPGTQEVIVGDSVRTKFAGTDLGQSIRLVGTDWKIVGLFAAGRSAFSSEIWGDADILMRAFNRDQFSSVVFRLKEGVDITELRNYLDKDKRMSVVIQYEREFFENQSKSLALFIRIVGIFVSVIFSLGAMIGAMITMYNSVSNRIREIGVLRALGFSRASVVMSFIEECALIGLCGAFLALIFSLLLLRVTFATTNFDTFSDIAFGFTLTPRIAMEGIIFGVVMAIIGGSLPAIAAGRLDIVNALRRG